MFNTRVTLDMDIFALVCSPVIVSGHHIIQLVQIQGYSSSWVDERKRPKSIQYNSEEGDQVEDLIHVGNRSSCEEYLNWIQVKDLEQLAAPFQDPLFIDVQEMTKLRSEFDALRTLVHSLQLELQALKSTKIDVCGVSLDEHAFEDALMEPTAAEGFYFLLSRSEFRRSLASSSMTEMLDTKDKVTKFDKLHAMWIKRWVGKQQVVTGVIWTAEQIELAKKQVRMAFAKKQQNKRGRHKRAKAKESSSSNEVSENSDMFVRESTPEGSP